MKLIRAILVAALVFGFMPMANIANAQVASCEAPINISNNDGNDDEEPKIYGDYVVWYGDDGNDWEIYLYRISTATLIGNISNNGIGDSRPQVYGDYVVWQGDEIYLYQISTATLIGKISSIDGNSDQDPQIYGDYVVWYGEDGDTYEIYLQDTCFAKPTDEVFKDGFESGE